MMYSPMDAEDAPLSLDGQRIVGYVGSALVAFTYWSMLNSCLANTFWQNFDVAALGMNLPAMIGLVVILIVLPLLLGIGSINRILEKPIRRYGELVAVSFLLMWMIAEQCNFSGVTVIPGEAKLYVQNIFINLAFIAWTVTDICRLSCAENAQVTSWCLYRLTGLAIYNFVNWAAGSTNPASAWPALGCSLFCIALQGLLYAQPLRANEVVLPHTKDCGKNAAAWVLVGIELGCIRFITFSLFLGNSSVARWAGTNPDTTGPWAGTVTVACVVAFLAQVPQLRVTMLGAGAVLAVLGASIMAFYQASTGGGIRVVVCGAVPLAISSLVGWYLMAHHIALFRGKEGFAIALSSVLHVLFIVLTIDVLEGASGLGLGLHGMAGELLFGATLTFWIAMLIVEFVLVKGAPSIPEATNIMDLPREAYIPIAVFVAIVLAVKFATSDMYTFIGNLENQALSGEYQYPRFVDAKNFRDPDGLELNHSLAKHSSEALGSTFRVASYNVQQMYAMVPRGANNLPRVAEALYLERVDIVGISEASGGNWFLYGNNDPVAFLTAKAGFRHSVFAAPTAASSEGVAIASRFPFVSSTWKKLHKLGKLECDAIKEDVDCAKLRNSFLAEATVQVDDTHEFTLLVSHTLYKPVEVAARELTEVAARVVELKKEGKAVVAMGDWNLQPASYPIKDFAKTTGLKSALPLNVPNISLQEKGRINSQGFTAAADLHFTESFEHTQIDYIFYSDELKLVNSKVAQAASEFVSDHLLVVAEFSFA